MAISLDVGTSFLVSARKKEDGNIKFIKLRDAFFSIEETEFIRNMLESIKVSYIAKEGQLYVIGEPGLELAASFNTEARRPMSQGMLSPKEKEALPIIKIMFEELLGKPKYENEICHYSVPANPLDAPKDVNYHEGIIKSVIESLGFKASPMNEALAIIYSELLSEKFTGLGISWGGGMVNLCFANMSVPVFSFSIAKSGDWIDQMVAQSQGMVASRITQIKENELDLSKDQDDIILKSLKIYYSTLIKNVLQVCKKKFQESADLPILSEGISIAVAGGTSMPKGFVELLQKTIDEIKLPINIKKIIRAEKPLYAVASGLLTAALSTELKDTKTKGSEAVKKND